jgi:DNA-binding CsgD family transcriptional regulator
VQDVIVSHVNGERTREHPHFLKSTLYCGSCGERLLVQIATSATGIKYPYFMCAGRHSKRTLCEQKSVLIYEVEKKIEAYYERIQLAPDFRARVETMIREGLKEARADIEDEQHALKREQDKLERQQGKLMEAHYAGAIPVDLLAREQERIGRSLQQIGAKLAATNAHFDTVERNLQAALDLTENCGAAYKAAPDHIKKLFNQALFEKILVTFDTGTLDGITITTQLNPPFDTLLSAQIRGAESAWTVSAWSLKKKTEKPAETGGPTDVLCETVLTHVQSLSKTLLVELSAADANKWRPVLEFKHELPNSLSDPDFTEQTNPGPADDYEEVRSIRQYQRRLTHEQLDRVVERYRQGATVYELAAEFGCNRKTISERLKRVGVQMRGGSPNDDQMDEMVRLYKSGLSLARVGDQVDVSAGTVLAALRARGIETRDTHGRSR